MIEQRLAKEKKGYQPLGLWMFVRDYKSILAGGGMAMTVLFWQLPWGSRLWWGLYFSFMMVILSVLDLRYGLLYDKLVLPLFFMGGLLSLGGITVPWQESLTGALSAGGFLWGLRMISGGGLGLGDVKLGMAMGSWLGWQAAVVAMFLAFLAGGMAACFLLFVRRGRLSTAIPFGPYMALGAFVGFIWGKECWQLYLTLL